MRAIFISNHYRMCISTQPKMGLFILNVLSSKTLYALPLKQNAVESSITAIKPSSFDGLCRPWVTNRHQRKFLRTTPRPHPLSMQPCGQSALKRGVCAGTGCETNFSRLLFGFGGRKAPRTRPIIFLNITHRPIIGRYARIISFRVIDVFLLSCLPFGSIHLSGEGVLNLPP